MQLREKKIFFQLTNCDSIFCKIFENIFIPIFKLFIFALQNFEKTKKREKNAFP